ncbi:efflux RND transporter periplasmic adaptor subunit [Sandaracinobacteroides saxicola]|uniref:Efflux RND transporter periplasmic adaptor subunit n=1 Tax=Sandaracinobacteroides saxicola TaxID=2759707 RepID=A0A7G5IGQ2_9SPHN|nr:efflux RND transporter periplasmic adaptor subunit [Sandaracinobacteroides saxicola]QMW22544.1 efflux RND transporter periplasmic adaptor subunit [Sandaracinobacteroides saxicola]
MSKRLSFHRLTPSLVPLLLLAAGCSQGEAKDDAAKGSGGGGGRAPSVFVGTVATASLSDRIEAVGTAVANEQASLNSTVNERIESVRFADGAFVPKGAVIATLLQAEESANLGVQSARLKEAELQLARLRQLQAQGFATKARIDEQVAAVETARAQGNAVRAQIGDRVIRAPFSGWLTLRRVSPGAIVTTGTPIATIVDYSRIKLDFTVPELLLATIRPGLAIEATAPAFPGETFTGTVASIDPLVDPVTRAVTVRALLPNPQLKLRPGMLLTVELSGRPRQTLVVPELAVLGQGGENFVYRVGQDNKAVRTPVEIGIKRDGKVEIRSGLSAGTRIVIDGTVKVRDGGAIRPVDPQAARAGRPQKAAA